MNHIAEGAACSHKHKRAQLCKAAAPAPISSKVVIYDQLQASWQSFGFAKEMLNAWDGQDSWIIYNVILF